MTRVVDAFGVTESKLYCWTVPCGDGDKVDCVELQVIE